MNEITDKANFIIPDNDSACFQYFGINNTIAFFSLNSGPVFKLEAVSGQYYNECTGLIECDNKLIISMSSPENSLTWDSAVITWDEATFPWNVQNLVFDSEFCADCNDCCDDPQIYTFSYLNEKGLRDNYRFEYLGLNCECHSFCITRNNITQELSSSSSISSQSSSSVSSSSVSSSSVSSSSMSSLSSLSSSSESCTSSDSSLSSESSVAVILNFQYERVCCPTAVDRNFRYLPCEEYNYEYEECPDFTYTYEECPPFSSSSSSISSISSSMSSSRSSSSLSSNSSSSISSLSSSSS